MKSFKYNTVIVGAGAAGFACALRLFEMGRTDIAIIADDVKSGTSRNAGSDKQTYYKLSLSGSAADSPHDMARDLVSGGCVDGDVALCEAACSLRAFMRLVELGVPFPQNAFGEFVGYKTDHDPRARATSAGPLTSKLMTECLEREAERLRIKIHSGYLAIKINGGVLAIDRAGELCAFNCKNVVWATGGPAGIYQNTVYPEGHFGMSGALYEAGAAGRNLTEWQYGLASVAPKWNVSGTYMQCLPRFFSLDADGKKRFFLEDAYSDTADCLLNIFKKGYEWPFDCKKTQASSRVDMLVYSEEIERGREVYLDFRENPYGGAPDFDALPDEARDYIKSAGADFGTPVERLIHMNAPAYELYLSKGLDLKREPLKISVCAQHNNGGAAVDLWWRTRVPGLYVIGEAAGTHGLYRPGGSALNAGQVGALRAAGHIYARGGGEPGEMEIDIDPAIYIGGDTCRELTRSYQARMSAAAAAIRKPCEIAALLKDVEGALENFDSIARVPDKTRLWDAFRLRDMLVADKMYLFAMLDYASRGGGSRGSAIYPEPAKASLTDVHQSVYLRGGRAEAEWQKVNPLPEGGGFFENVWREFRENGGVRD